jgi:hypothetical protein
MKVLLHFLIILLFIMVWNLDHRVREQAKYIEQLQRNSIMSGDILLSIGEIMGLQRPEAKEEENGP